MSKAMASCDGSVLSQAASPATVDVLSYRLLLLPAAVSFIQPGRRRGPGPLLKDVHRISWVQALEAAPRCALKRCTCPFM